MVWGVGKPAFICSMSVVGETTRFRGGGGNRHRRIIRLLSTRWSLNSPKVNASWSVFINLAFGDKRHYQSPKIWTPEQAQPGWSPAAMLLHYPVRCASSLLHSEASEMQMFKSCSSKQRLAGVSFFKKVDRELRTSRRNTIITGPMGTRPKNAGLIVG